ncbi:hypothetical protein ACRAWD_30090 [Caulobacter segnis]
MFGHSYGGYSALAASIRPNAPYQCAAGAGGSLADMEARHRRKPYDARVPAALRRWPRRDQARQGRPDPDLPLSRRARHQRRHQGVPQLHRGAQGGEQAFTSGLEIKDMGHSYDTMTPAMLAKTQLVEIEKFFDTECKPGGL